MLKRRDRKLSVAQGKRIYDLPLNKSEGTGFLVLLISLMSFLACISLTASFALDEVGRRWSSVAKERMMRAARCAAKHALGRGCFGWITC